MYLVNQLKRHEDERLKPYFCPSNKITIGVGRNLDDVGITLEESEMMLINDISRVRKELVRNVDCFMWLSKVRQEALINMGFNLGVSGLLNFKKMFKHLDNANYSKAAVEMLDSKWAYQVGNRATELSTQMITGRYL